MATKAEQFRAVELVERSVRKAKAKPPRAKAGRPRSSKPHNLSVKAGRTATVQYEQSTGSASRKSTRGSSRHQRAANVLERTNQLKQNRPEVRAELARTHAIKTRGKPR